MLNVSDIYGTTQTGRDNTSATTNPSANAPQQAQVNADIKGVGMNYGFLALVGFIGVLLGAKFLMERKAS